MNNSYCFSKILTKAEYVLERYSLVKEDASGMTSRELLVVSIGNEQLGIRK